MLATFYIKKEVYIRIETNVVKNWTIFILQYIIKYNHTTSLFTHTEESQDVSLPM